MTSWTKRRGGGGGEGGTMGSSQDFGIQGGSSLPPPPPRISATTSHQPIEYIAPSSSSTKSRLPHHGRSSSTHASGSSLSASFSSSGLSFSKFFGKSKGKGQAARQHVEPDAPRSQKLTDDWEFVGDGGRDGQGVQGAHHRFPSSGTGLGLSLGPETNNGAKRPNEVRLSTGEAFTMAGPSRRRSSARTSQSKSPHHRQSFSMFRPSSPSVIEEQRILPAERTQRIAAAEAHQVYPLLAPEHVRGLSPSINAQLQSFAFPTSDSPDPAAEASTGRHSFAAHPSRGKSKSLGNALELANVAPASEHVLEQSRKSKPSLPPMPAQQQRSQEDSSHRTRAISMMETSLPSSGSMPTANRPPSRGLARKFSLLRGPGRGGPVSSDALTLTEAEGSSGIGTQSTPRRRPDNLTATVSTSSSMPLPSAAKKSSSSSTPFAFRRLSIKRSNKIDAVAASAGQRNVHTPEIESWREQGISRRQSQIQEQPVEPPVVLVRPDASFTRRRDEDLAGTQHDRALSYSYEATAPPPRTDLQRNNSGSLSLRKRWQSRSKSFDLLSRSSRSNPTPRAASRATSDISSATGAGAATTTMMTTAAATKAPGFHHQHPRPSISREDVVPRKPVPSYDDVERASTTPTERPRTTSNPTSVLTSAAVADEAITPTQPAAGKSPRLARIRGKLTPPRPSHDAQNWGRPSSAATSASRPPTASSNYFPLQLDALSLHYDGETTDGGAFSDVASTVRPQQRAPDRRQQGEMLDSSRPPSEAREESYDAVESRMRAGDGAADPSGRLLAPPSALPSTRSDPNSSIGSSNSAGRPYSMISVGSGDTPIVQYRRLIVDTKDRERGEIDQGEGQGASGGQDHDGLWFRKPGKQRVAAEEIFGHGAENSERRLRDDNSDHLDAASATATARLEGTDSVMPLASTEDGPSSGMGNSGTARRASVLTSDGDTALSALEAEVTMAKRLVLGRSRANTLELMNHLQQEQNTYEEEQRARASLPPTAGHTRKDASTPPLQPDLHARAEPVAIDSLTSRPSRRDEDLAWDALRSEAAILASRDHRGNLHRSASVLGLTSSSDDGDDDDLRRRASPLIDGLRTTKSVYLPNSTVPKIPSSTALRRSRSALAARFTPNSSPEEGVKPDEFEPPPPPRALSKVAFRSRRADDENGPAAEAGMADDIDTARHVPSKSSLRTRAGKKQTFATSEEAIQARQREEVGKEKRRQQREREKEKLRQRRYADMKKNDPLLAERLALVGLKSSSAAMDGKSAEESGQTPKAASGRQELPLHDWPAVKMAEALGEADQQGGPAKEDRLMDAVPTVAASSPPRQSPLHGAGNPSSLDDSISFERPKRASLLSQNPVNAKAEISSPTQGSASGLMADLARTATGQRQHKTSGVGNSPQIDSHRRTSSLFDASPTVGKAGNASDSPTLDRSGGPNQTSSHRTSRSLSAFGEVQTSTPAAGRPRGDSIAETSASISVLGTPIPSLDFPDPPERAQESRSADGTVLSTGVLSSPTTPSPDDAQKTQDEHNQRNTRPQPQPLFIYAPHPSERAAGNAMMSGGSETHSLSSNAGTPQAATFARDVQETGQSSVPSASPASPQPVLKTIRRSRSKVIKPPAGPRPQPTSPSASSSPPPRQATLGDRLGIDSGDVLQSESVPTEAHSDARHRSLMAQVEWAD